jgi:predicted membrane GTPase involved in stress response
LQGFELAVSPPSVIYIMKDGKKLEPIGATFWQIFVTLYAGLHRSSSEEVMVDVDQEHIGLMIDRISMSLLCSPSTAG